MSTALTYILFFRQGYGFAMAILIYALSSFMQAQGLQVGILNQLVLIIGIFALPLAALLLGHYLDLFLHKSRSLELLIFALANFIMLRGDYFDKIIDLSLALSSGKIALSLSLITLMITKIILAAGIVTFCFYILLLVIELPFYWVNGAFNQTIKIAALRPILIVFSFSLVTNLIFNFALRTLP